LQTRIKGPWTRGQIEQFLTTSRYPLRLASTGADGYPRVVSVWFAYADGQFFCVSHRSSGLISLLRANPRVGFEVAPNEPPYRGVRGQGDAVVAEQGGAGMLEGLLERYLGGIDSGLASWLLSRSEDELLVTIAVNRWFSWDYSERMVGSSGAASTS